MNKKYQQNIYHGSMDVSLNVENVAPIKSWIMVNVGVSVKILKIIICMKKIIFGILQHLVVKMVII